MKKKTTALIILPIYIRPHSKNPSSSIPGKSTYISFYMRNLFPRINTARWRPTDKVAAPPRSLGTVLSLRVFDARAMIIQI